MALHDDVAKLREERGNTFPDELQGVSRDKVREVMRFIGFGENRDLVDAVFALLDNETDSWFAKPPAGAKFEDGATTAHIGCHVGILQRGGGKLDREGRDYWIKPLRQVGGIEAITLQDGEFVAGHIRAKSPSSCYRLDPRLKAILMAPDGEWQKMIKEWASDDVARERLAFQAEMEEASKRAAGNSHADLIKASVEDYAGRFLKGYMLLYVDDADGDRISDREREAMKKAGVELTLGDAMPDALLWNPETDWLWVIEAVTSDGEVDAHKVAQMKKLAERGGKAGIGFTTTYRTWKEAAARQGTHRNLAVGSCVWIQADPAKVLVVEGWD